jgi:predicted TIM-barrel fold metal-dependent hydrolase
MRIDAAVSLPRGRDSGDALGAILKRNKFDGALVFGSSEAEFPWVKGIILAEDAPGGDSMARAVRVHSVEAARRWVPSGLAIDLHVEDLTAAIPFVLEYPRTAIIPRLDDDVERWATAIGRIARETAAFVKVADMVTNVSAEVLRPYVQFLLRTLGPERLIYASAWPKGLPDWGWKQSLAVFTQAMGPRSLEHREMILGGNAGRLYRLD